jgi:BMFP domain-containing protein YqiC
MMTENVVAVTRIGNEAMDLVLRNLRLASRQDINRLTRALGRTEDKLEQVLQEVEELRDELSSSSKPNGTSRSRSGGNSASGSTGTRRRRSSSS